MKKSRGFSLLELVIVVVIVGVLSSVAKPFYIEYRTKAERENAKAEILKMADYLEAYRAVNGNYDGAELPIVTRMQFYEIYFAEMDTIYYLRAFPVSTTTQADDGVLCYNQNGYKLKQPRAATNCGDISATTTW